MGWRGALWATEGMVWWLSKTRVKFIRSHPPVSNGDLLAGLAVPGPKALHGCHVCMPSFTLPKATCLPSNPPSLGSADENLGTVCVGARHLPWTRCQDLYASEWNSHHQISRHRWTCHQYHYGVWSHHPGTKSWNYSVKAGTFITKSFLSSAQSTKVFCCLWNFVSKQLKREPWPQGLAINSDVEEHGGVDHG